jgi:hypothetical protein
MSWQEQRYHNEMAVQALEYDNTSAVAHPLLAKWDLRSEYERLARPEAPAVGELKKIDKMTSTVGLANGMALGFDGTTGAIIKLLSGDGTTTWADDNHPMAGFSYQTLNDSDWKPFTYDYINGHGMSQGFCKPGSNNYSEQMHFHPVMTALYVNDLSCVSNPSAAGAPYAGAPYAGASCRTVLVEMEMPTRAVQRYGSPSKLYLNVTVAAEPVPPMATRNANTRVGSTRGSSSKLLLALTFVEKTPTMIGESMMLTFKPALPLLTTKAWAMDKLGSPVDPEDVQDGGNQMNHGVWSGVTATDQHGATMHLNSLDAPNMCPVTADYPYGNPLPAGSDGLKQLAAGSVKGMGVNIHNNLWNTNYPLFYPYYDKLHCPNGDPFTCSNRNGLFRFELTLSTQ